jgi:hypothetical protein
MPAALLAVMTFALSGCQNGSGGGEQQIYAVGTFSIARDEFLRPGTYEVEDVGEYACVIWVLHGPSDTDISDFAHVFEDYEAGWDDGDPRELTIRPEDISIVTDTDRCLLTRQGD